MALQICCFYPPFCRTLRQQKIQNNPISSSHSSSSSSSSSSSTKSVTLVGCFKASFSTQKKHNPPRRRSRSDALDYQEKNVVLVVPGVCPSKRKLINLSILAALVITNGSLPNVSKATLAQELELERYTDSNQGFTLLKPTSYVKVDKAGATVLFEEVNKGSNNIGVVVNPVRLTTLAQFGTPEFVADKLIQAEKRKESTKEAEVIGVAERSGHGDLQVYEFEYKVDSTRGGMKRIFSAAFVAAKKLYLLNIVHSDKPESPLDTHTRTMLEEVLHSFDAVPMT